MINFGVNIYALDIDMHTAQELAAINNADNVLRYLDAVVAKVVCRNDWTHVNVIIMINQISRLHLTDTFGLHY